MDAKQPAPSAFIERIMPTSAFIIKGAPQLDPITVIVRDFELGRGQIIIECYGRAWAAYWGAMGGVNLATFFINCGADYLANRLRPAGIRITKAEQEYLVRIVRAVQDALRESSPLPPWLCSGCGTHNAWRLKQCGVCGAPDVERRS